jgi:DNA-binding MarR family transcriptional regulator
VSREEPIVERTAFLLSKLGQAVTNRFADRLVPLGLRPRHCAVLELLRGTPMTQLDLARNIGVTPSVVVDMLDEMEGLDAVRRVRDTADRRRQLVELTPEGTRLCRRARQLARQLDAELLRGLEPDRAEALRDTLRQLATAEMITVGSRTAPAPATGSAKRSR